MKKLLVYIAFFLALLAESQAATMLQTAQEVLQSLHEHSGFPNTEIPQLVLSYKSEKVAAYYPALNKIVLETKAYKVCQSLGRDSLQALAFLLGHELAHSFQTEKAHPHHTNFLSYDKHFEGAIRLEKTADIQGALNAYLAGYGVFNKMPEFMDRLYVEYHLKGKNLSGYPTLSERKATANEVQVIVKNLTGLFESVNYVITLNDYQTVKDCYEYILRYHRGREIYNNLGVIYLLNALENHDVTTDRFLYPLRLDENLLLQNPNPSRGGILNNYKRRLRDEFLKRAIKNLKTAISIDSDYQLAKTNLLSAFNLSGQPDSTIFYYKKYCKNGCSEEAKINWVLAKSMSGQKGDESKKILQKLTMSDNLILKNQAVHNLSILEKPNAKSEFANAPLKLPTIVSKIITNLPFEKCQVNEWLYLSENTDTYFSKSGNPSKTFFNFEKGDGTSYNFIRTKIKRHQQFNIFSKGIIPSIIFYSNLLPLKSGFILIDPNQNFILKIDKKGKLEEVVQVRRS